MGEKHSKEQRNVSEPVKQRIVSRTKPRPTVPETSSCNNATAPEPVEQRNVSQTQHSPRFPETSKRDNATTSAPVMQRNESETQHPPQLPETSKRDNDTASAPVMQRNESETQHPPKLPETSKRYNGEPNHSKTKVVHNPKKSALIVAAIDFGTSHSRCGFSFRHNPNDVKAINENSQTPTTVLLTPEKVFDSFGTDALKKYKVLIANDNNKSWYYFENFKMKLFVKDEPLGKTSELEDFTGKKLPASVVFTAAIKYLKEQVIDVINSSPKGTKWKKGNSFDAATDIHWVLTVPAIWNDLSKLFMRQTAQQAGIPGDMLTLALEPEAASLYCEDTFGKSVISVGCKYLILDLGGGTADIACHEKTSKGLKELSIPTGGDFGGMMANNKFISVLTSLFGGDVLRVFKKNHPVDYLELIYAFERKKRFFTGDFNIKLKFPPELLEIYHKCTEEALHVSMKQSKLCNRVEFKDGFMIISKDLATEIFHDAVDKIKDEVEKLTAKVNVEYVILVGGFSGSPYVQKVISEIFSNTKIPKQPELAVMHGAVLFGHNPRCIISRKCRYTYGIPRMMKFKPHHLQKKKVTIDGIDYCDDLFNKHIEIGEEMSIDDTDKIKAQEYFPVMTDMKQAVVEVYASTKKDPTYIDEDGCTHAGLIRIDIDPQGDIYSKILVKLVFGGTELVVEVTDTKTGRVTVGSVDFFG